MYFSLLLLGLLFGLSTAASTPPPAARILVKSLPGYDVEANGPLPTLYSGHLPAGTPPSGKGTMYLHYVFFEATGVKNPKEAPVVFWYNGGPGACSLFGMFDELGPLFLNQNSLRTKAYLKSRVPSLLPNPASWSERFNLVSIDSPAPVGLSYCTEEGPSGGGYSCGNWTDEAVFAGNYLAIKAFFHEVFPEYLNNEVYITGESYAGVYIPGLVNEFLKDISADSDSLARKTNTTSTTSSNKMAINLKGFAVGDGCMGNEVVCININNPMLTYPNVFPGPYYDLMFFAGHGQLSNELYQRILSDCPKDTLLSGHLSPHCENLLSIARAKVQDIFVYDVYQQCPIPKGFYPNLPFNGPAPALAENGYICPGDVVNQYFNGSSPDVLAAFGIDLSNNFFNADNGHGMNYKLSCSDVRPFYKAAQKAGLRILNYEGDADASGLSSYGLQDIYISLWEKDVGLERTVDWEPWTRDNKSAVGGYIYQWGENVAHLTVRGSGHMVPLNKPFQSKAMIEAFVLNKGVYPRYNPQ